MTDRQTWVPPDNHEDYVDVALEDVDSKLVPIEQTQTNEKVIVRICGPVLHVEQGPKPKHPWQYPEIWDCETYDLTLHRTSFVDALDYQRRLTHHVQIKSLLPYDADRCEYGTVALRPKQHDWLLDHQADVLERIGFANEGYYHINVYLPVSDRTLLILTDTQIMATDLEQAVSPLHFTRREKDSDEREARRSWRKIPGLTLHEARQRLYNLGTYLTKLGITDSADVNLGTVIDDDAIRRLRGIHAK